MAEKIGLLNIISLTKNLPVKNFEENYESEYDNEKGILITVCVVGFIKSISREKYEFFIIDGTGPAIKIKFQEKEMDLEEKNWVLVLGRINNNSNDIYLNKIVKLKDINGFFYHLVSSISESYEKNLGIFFKSLNEIENQVNLPEKSKELYLFMKDKLGKGVEPININSLEKDFGKEVRKELKPIIDAGLAFFSDDLEESIYLTVK